MENKTNKKFNFLKKSPSDSQLYKKNIRKKMYIGKGENGIDNTEINKNNNQILSRKKITFKGDGSLGIIFQNKNDMMCIKDVINNTIASNHHKLIKNMIIYKINDINCKELGYSKSKGLLMEIWENESCITLYFEYENIKNIIDTPLNNPIYKFLESVDCEDFYSSFIELGASNIDDLKFIEYDDLVLMKMPPFKRRKIHSILLNNNDKLDYLSKIIINFTPEAVKRENDKELEKIKILHSQKFEKINI